MHSFQFKLETDHVHIKQTKIYILSFAVLPFLFCVIMCCKEIFTIWESYGIPHWSVIPIVSFRMSKKWQAYCRPWKDTHSLEAWHKPCKFEKSASSVTFLRAWWSRMFQDTLFHSKVILLFPNHRPTFNLKEKRNICRLWRNIALSCIRGEMNSCQVWVRSTAGSGSAESSCSDESLPSTWATRCKRP